ncbi:MAG: hypothetical protein WA814_05345 [Candidatus Baltobacteraceae bacterium]
MNRKEMTCTAVGVLLGAAGCSPAVKSLAVPVANAEETAAANVAPVPKVPHLGEVLLSLISGTTKDISSVVFRLAPDSGWSVVSNNPRLDVSMERGHIATLQAPEDKQEQFVATATISHSDGTQFLVRCHVEAGC